MSPTSQLVAADELDRSKFPFAHDDMLAVCGFDGRFTRLDDAWAAGGFDVEGMLARPMFDFIHPGDHAATASEAERLSTVDRVQVAFRNRYRRADGTYRHLEWRTTSDHGAERFYCVARDITDLVSLQAEREKLAAMVETAGDAVSQRTADGTLISFNHGAEELYGVSAEEVLGGTAFVVVPDSHRELEHEVLARAGAGEVVRYETERVRLDGRRLHVAVTLSPVLGPDGEVVSISAVTRDITARVRAEAERERLLDDLERSNADLTQFAYIASHDLSEPLRSIGGFLSLLEHRYDDVLDDRGRDYIRRVIAASTRMRGLIDDLLEYSRSSRAELAQTDVDLNELVAAALEGQQARISATHAEVEVDELPVVRADARGLGQVLDNLLGNALKFARPGEPPRVHVRAAVRPGAWELSVEDGGIGIEPRHRVRAFEIFKRLNAATDYDGTGIGLSVCKTVVERHGGRIWIEDSPLGGTRFVLAVPTEGAPA